MAVGEAATETFTWAAKAAPQIVKVIIDPDNNVTESDKSNNEKIANPNNIGKYTKRLRRVHKALSRKRKGSSNRKKAKKILKK